jgi:CubicO group peptidase (beta-lactamase class C family)
MGVSPAALGAVLDQFHRNFDDDGELGASVSVWWRGAEVLREGRGWCERTHRRRWTGDTLVPVYSATKGPASAALLLALDEHGLDVETRVCEVWPRFPVAEASFGDLLSHQCGLAALDRAADAWKHEEIVGAIEAQAPAWRPGGGHGYHPRTFGTLVDEPVRRLTGMPLGAFWNERVAMPLGLEFWIGLPESEFPRVAELHPGRARVGERDALFYQEFAREGALTFRAFRSPSGFRSVREMNDPKAWQAGFPAKGGVGTASALAKFYQVAIGVLPGPFGPKVLAALGTRRIQGDDRVLMQPTAFSAGCQMDPLDAAGAKLRHLYGPERDAFGHPGAGGSHAFGDPENGISFAYTMNQMELSVLPGAKSTVMIERLYSD